MTYLVEPLFTEWARFSDTRLSQTMLGHVGLNKASWKGLQREQPSGEDTEAAFEELNSQLLPQENRLSWLQSQRGTLPPGGPRKCEMGAWGERTYSWLPRLPSEWRQHYLCPGPPLSDHLNPLFNSKTWTHSNMDLALTWNLASAKTGRSESGRNNQGSCVECHVLLRAFTLRTTKLELSLSAETWNEPVCCGACICTSHQVLAERWGTWSASLCCLWPDSMFTNQLWDTASEFALEHNSEGTTKSFIDQTLNCSSFPLVCLFSSLDATKASPCYSLTLCTGDRAYPRVPPSFPSSAVWQCGFF